jgi:hypothetical protein
MTWMPQVSPKLRDLGDYQTPKFSSHVSQNQRDMGHPTFYSTWLRLFDHQNSPVLVGTGPS